MKAVRIHETGGPEVLRHGDELVSRMSEIFEWLVRGLLRLHIGATYPLRDAAEAHRDLESRRTTGKLLLLN